MPFDLGRVLDAAAGKALSPHPALSSNSAVSIYQPGASRQAAKLSQREASKHLSAYGGDEAIDHVMNATDFYATTAANAQWRLQKPDGTRLVQEKTENDPKDVQVGPKDLYELLKVPNPFMLYDDLIEHLIIDLLLVGNGYWLKWKPNNEGQPLALYRLAPQYVKIIPGSWGPKRYEYQIPGQRDPMKIDPKNIVHMKLPNPHDAFYGMGVVRKGGRAMDLELEITETMTSYYGNKADPSLIVESERRVPRDVFQKLRAQLRGRVAGPRNAGELLVLEAGLKASTLSPKASEALFQEVGNLSAARIFAMFRLNPKLLGYAGDGSSADKISDARREFDTYVMRPFLDKLERRITANIVAAWDVEFKIDYNYVIPQDELLKNVSTLASIPGIKVRELRRAMIPLGFLDGESTGDPEIDEEILNMPMEEMDATGQGGAADRPLAGEAGRPPLGENTTNFSKVRKPSQTKRAAQTKALEPMDALSDLQEALKRAEAKAVTVKDDPNVTVSVGRKLRDEQRPQDPTSRARMREVDATAAFIQAGIKEEAIKLERALLDHVEGKAFSKKDVVNRMRKSEAWVVFREGVERVLKDAGRRAVSSAAMDQADAGRIPDDDLDYDSIVNSVVHRRDGLAKIMRTFKRRTLAKIQNLGPDATTQEANAVVQQHIGEFNAGHVANIAMSEAVELYNEGVLSIAEATGATEVYVVEEEDAPDQPCIDAKDSVWTIDYARDHRKEHPNCRRGFVALDPVS